MAVANRHTKLTIGGIASRFADFLAIKFPDTNTQEALNFTVFAKPDLIARRQVAILTDTRTGYIYRVTE